ncbi:MAG: sulfatase [Pirellulaceae bacterium]|nr:sulfatase [Pirellulaceae bacterium]
MNQRVLVCIALSIMWGSFTQAARNVVLLISDNQNKDDCGCYGNRVIQTPNIDRLAKQGIKFADAFATTASCGPSRAVIYSGLQTHSNGQYGHGHGIHTFRLAPKVQTVFSLLGQNGYHTALLGKRHTTPDEAYPFTFDKAVNGRDVDGIAKLAAEFIQQAGDEPFCLTVGFSDPHPTSRDRPGWGAIPKYSAGGLAEYSPDEVIVPDYLPDRPEVREGLAGYYQQISQLDHGVGMILDALDASGKGDDTLVIFTSDHGSSEPGAMGNHYEPGIQVPMIVRCPTAEKPSTTSPALVTLADITPTILDWTGTQPPKYPLHGRSFLPILTGDETQGWDDVYLSHVCHEVTMYYPMRSYRDRRHKLIWNVAWRSEYPLPIDTLNRATWTEAIRRGEPTMGRRTIEKFLFRDQIELYDLQNDPHEIVNLADDPSHADLRRDLTNKLMAWLQRTNDPWLERHRPTLPGEPIRAASMQTTIKSIAP